MGYPLTVALRYLASKKRNMVSISTALAVGGVTLGVAALTIVMSVTGGFQEQFREKVLGVNAHVLVLKYSIDFREYREVMKKVEDVPHVVGVAPFVINPMMLTHGVQTATGVLLKGVDPDLLPKVLDLPKHVVEGSLAGLRGPDAVAPARSAGSASDEIEMPGTPSFRKRSRMTDGPSSGRPLTSDAGTDPLLAAIQREIDENLHPGDAQTAPAPSLPHDDGSVAAAAQAASTDRNAEAASGRDRADLAPSRRGRAPARGVRANGKITAKSRSAPVGDVTPRGGYKSRLPDVDVLPDAIDPDPCKSADRVAKMPGIVVGRTLARQLDVGVGACVQVTSPQIGLSFGNGARSPIAKQFRVIAVFEAGFDQYDSKLAYADLYEAQAFYEYGDSVTGVEMKLDDIDRAGAVAKEITKRLNNGMYNTMTWYQLNHGLFTALLLQQIMMSVALGLIILVAACSVIATLIMVVLEKKKEIALLKALGAKNDAILRIFLYQGGMIGLAGTGFGVLVGWLACRFLIAYAFPLDPKVYFISRLPVSMHPVEFIVPAIVAVVICLVATIFPAVSAAQLRPAEGLRAE